MAETGNVHPLRQHLIEQFSGRAVKTVEVPGWPEPVYFKVPNLSTLKQTMADAKGDPVEMQARVVVACAEDGKGVKIWPNKIDYTEVMTRIDPGIVARIANAIMAEAKLDVAAAEGN